MLLVGFYWFSKLEYPFYLPAVQSRIFYHIYESRTIKCLATQLKSRQESGGNMPILVLRHLCKTGNCHLVRIICAICNVGHTDNNWYIQIRKVVNISMRT
jgi:hypothetical protein